MMTMLAPWGACMVEAGTPNAAQDLGGEGEPQAPGQDLRTLAEVAIPTEDGQASYRFRFARVDDGPMLATIESPLGYPAPRIPTECALETFLRVARADSLVPSELIEECLSPAERVELGLPGEGAVSVRAVALQDPESTLEFDAQAADALCNADAFDKRVAELKVLAAYQPDIPINCQSECEYGVIWDGTGCGYIDENGTNLGLCSDLDYQTLLMQYGPYGFLCLEQGPPVCDFVPNPECAHTEYVLGDWGPFGVWERKSNEFSRTTRVRVEVSSCDPEEPTTGWWRMKENSADPFGAQNPVFWPAGTHSTLILSAGWDESDNWRGWDFQIHAAGTNFHVANAWVELQGKNRFRCPLAI
jgi:hypothetical protein